MHVHNYTDLQGHAGAYNRSLWLFHSYISLLPFCSVCLPSLSLSRMTTSDQLLHLSSLFICYCFPQFPGTPAFSMLRSNVSQPCLMVNPQLSVEYHLCPEKITFLSRVISALTSGLVREKYYSLLRFLYLIH